MKLNNFITLPKLILGLLFLPLMASAQMEAPKEMPAGMQHNHTPKNVPDNALTPQLNISISEDDMSGFNLHLETHNFQLESPNQGGNAPDHIIEGHGHLYINGTKIQRVYGSDVHIPGKLINKGVNQISVTLNGHDHSTWRKNGKEIISTIFINTHKKKIISHQFSSFPIMVINH